MGIGRAGTIGATRIGFSTRSDKGCRMPDQVSLIDLKALLIEREDFDAGTVQKIREGLAQGGTQYRTLREAAQTLKKKVESASGALAKKWHLRLGMTSFFLGNLNDAIEHLRHADTPLASFYLGRALTDHGDYDEALKAYEKAEKAGYTASQVQLMRAGIFRKKGDIAQSRQVLARLENLASHSAEYHFQLGSCQLAEGNRPQAIALFERAADLDPGHTGALFQLAFANDLAGNDDEAIHYYERCLNYPPVHIGVLMNLGVLYEDSEKFDKAAECYRKVQHANPTDERAKLFLKDAEASVNMYYSPEEEQIMSKFSQVLEIPVTDFELSVRSRNCLKKMNIRTLGDLTRVTEAQLLSSKNFGETSLQEIKEMLGSKGLRIGQSLEQGSHYEMRHSRPQQPLSPEEQAILNKQVSELNLSVRARKCMNRLGINSLGDLVQRSADELLEAKNFGMTSLNEVREKLAQYGLTLRGE
jgi:DNA-directed RNA polymerase subunit alpha